MARGDVVIVSIPGDYGKPRPAVIVQDDLHAEHASIVVLPITTYALAAPTFRVRVQPDPTTGLREISQIMVDKIVALPRGKISPAVGRLADGTMREVSRALASFLGLAATSTERPA